MTGKGHINSQEMVEFAQNVAAVSCGNGGNVAGYCRSDPPKTSDITASLSSVSNLCPFMEKGQTIVHKT